MTQEDTFDISIVITHWNRPSRLLDLINYIHFSLFTNKPQLFEDLSIELIIIDSQSQSSQYVKSELIRHDKENCANVAFTTLYLDSNKGPSYARYHGLQLAKGKFIQFIDDDDWIDPQKLWLQFEWASDHPRADLIASCWARVEADAIIGTSQATVPVQPIFKIPVALSILEDFTHLSACLLKRSTLLAAKAFEEAFWLVEDVHLQLKLLRQGAIFEIAPATFPLFFYRSSPESGSLSTEANRQPFLLACLRNLYFAEEILLEMSQAKKDNLVRLSHLYFQLARGFFSCDPIIFRKTVAHIYLLNPNFLPLSPAKLRFASWVFGYATAERLSHWVRMLKFNI
jgi:glycosyltransferase involved in cell wall biosynthesis